MIKQLRLMVNSTASLLLSKSYFLSYGCFLGTSSLKLLPFVQYEEFCNPKPSFSECTLIVASTSSSL